MKIARTQEKIEKALKSTFRPEFLNRIDEIIMFSRIDQGTDDADRRFADERSSPAA